MPTTCQADRHSNCRASNSFPGSPADFAAKRICLGANILSRLFQDGDSPPVIVFSGAGNWPIPNQNANQRVPMKFILDDRGRPLVRQRAKPNRALRIQSLKLNVIFRPTSFGMKPQMTARMAP